VPVYEFSCLGCRHTFDVLGTYASRDARQVCPQCEGTNTRVLFSTFAVKSSGEVATTSAGGCGCGGGCACSN
jgi:putative FmdB family regulatory protein